MSEPKQEQQHVSDAAWGGALQPWGGERERLEWQHKSDGTVLITVAEHDELLAVKAWAAHNLTVHLDQTAEIDALRAEVERLRVYEQDIGPRIDRAQKVLSASGRHLGKHVIDGLCDEIERLRKGVMPNAEPEARDVRDAVAGAASAKTRIPMTVADNDHRLGTRLPDGEPCEPMSAWSWRRMS